MFDFRRATVFCLGFRLSKHIMIRYAKILGGHGSLGTLATPMNQVVVQQKMNLEIGTKTMQAHKA